MIAAAGIGSRLGMNLPKSLVEINGRTVLERLLTECLHDVADAAWYLQRWLGDAERMAGMQASARRIARPHAARDIAQALQASLPQA